MPSDVPGDEAANEERLRILQLLEQQRITAAEAADLLAALGERGRDGRRRERSRWLAEELAPPSDRARWIRVRVTDEGTGRVRTTFRCPSAWSGMIFDVSNEGGERVEIFID